MNDYSPIAQAFYRIDQTVEKQTKMKFDVAYMIAKEGISFAKMKSLCQLHGAVGLWWTDKTNWVDTSSRKRKDQPQSQDSVSNLTGVFLTGKTG